ncbi:hypothetical protein N431DRAFT_102006 [Stipitochalara longipes BDJ]|nr:hypothetical protein N431DRAFT_102006 [Stipitochalara longipes BDJ]
MFEVAEAPSASFSCACACDLSCGPSFVMMGFSSFFRFLLALPLEAFATCFAFWMAACLMCEPFMICAGGGAGRVWRSGLLARRGAVAVSAAGSVGWKSRDAAAAALRDAAPFC